VWPWKLRRQCYVPLWGDAEKNMSKYRIYYFTSAPMGFKILTDELSS
jgi:hypothetical protein